MRLRWFPDDSVALCADNYPRLFCFCFGPTALLDEDGFSPRFVFPILQNRRTTNTADIQQNDEGVDYPETRGREKINARKFSQEVTGRKSSLKNDWLIFHKGVRGRYLFV